MRPYDTEFGPVDDPTYGVKLQHASVNLGEIRRCRGKPIYDKKSALIVRNARYNQDHIKLRVYQCEHCNGWHLTKNL